MSIKAHRWKKRRLKLSVLQLIRDGLSLLRAVAKGAAVRLRPSRWNKMAKTGRELFYLCE